MQPGKKARRDMALLTVGLMVAMPVAAAFAQAVVTTENMVSQLADLEITAELDAAVLRQQASDRVKSKVDAVALKRPPRANSPKRSGNGPSSSPRSNSF